MPTFALLCAYGEALGSFVGAVSVIWSEVAYIRALRDGTVTDAERAHLKSIGWGLRIGMSAMLVSSIGLAIVAYTEHAALQPALTSGYWTFMILSLLIISVSWALARGRMPFALGSALVFTAWWLVTYLMYGWLPPMSLGGALAFFVVAATIFYALLSGLRLVSLRKS
jgi:hypothetical protein